MEDENSIWDRALGFTGDGGQGEGDLALSRLLNFHGIAMIGGVLNAVETLTSADVDAAIASYRWMGLNRAADSVKRVQDEVAGGALDDGDRAESLEQEGDAAYNSAVPTDATLQAAFRTKLAAVPGLFEGT